MRNVSTDNYVESADYLSFSYNHEDRDFDFLIGKILRGRNMIKMGRIVDVSYYKDGYGHRIAMAILDNGRRINCRTLGLK